MSQNGNNPALGTDTGKVKSAVVVRRKRTKKEIRQNEEHYRTLFNSMDEGCSIIEMIFDEHNKPVDWLYLEINPAFEKLTGMAEALGKRIRELVPALEQYWFELYGKVALTGPGSNRFYSTFCPMPSNTTGRAAQLPWSTRRTGRIRKPHQITQLQRSKHVNCRV